MKPSHLSVVAATVLGAVAGALALAAPAAAAEVVRDICFPVEGGPSAVHWTDTFGAPRGGGTRSHEGQDLMGRKGTVLLSAVDGWVREIVHQNDKGNRVVVQDDEGWFYVYLHVNNDTPGTDDGQATFEQAFVAGLQVGQRVSRCQPIAYMGDSGNAEDAGSHLHFEIREPHPPGHQLHGSTKPWAWSSATAVNAAASLLAASGSAGGGSGGSPLTSPGTKWAPFESARALVERQYLDFYGRAADADGAAYWTQRLHAGLENPATFIAKLLVAPELDARVAPVARLYWAYFRRIPDTEGLLHWLGEFNQGTPLGDIAQVFAGSPEFVATYGSLDDGAFVDLVYRNVLGRDPDDAGREHWVGVLAARRASRGGVMVGFSESPEHRAKLADRVRVVLAYVAMLGRAPDEGGLAHWVTRGLDELVAGIFASPEYAARIRARA